MREEIKMEGGEKIVDSFDVGDTSSTITNPVQHGSISMSSGAECTLTGKASVFTSTNYARIRPDGSQVPSNPNGSRNEDALTIIERKGIFSSQIINQGNIYSPEDAPSHYAISNGPPSTIPAGLRQSTSEPLVSGYTPKDHATILRQIGIDCTKNGVAIAPILSVDDVKALTKAALGQPVADKGRER